MPGLGVAGGGETCGGVIVEREHGLARSCREGEILLLAGGGSSLGGSCSSWGDDIRVARERAGHLETGRGEQLLILLLLELELVTVSSLKIGMSLVFITIVRDLGGRLDKRIQRTGTP